MFTEYGYGAPFVGGTGAGQVPPRLPLVPGLPGPTPPIAAPNVRFIYNPILKIQILLYVLYFSRLLEECPKDHHQAVL